MSLITFVLMEFKKVRGNRTFFITAIGALILPILHVILAIVAPDMSSDMVTSLDNVASSSLQLFSIIFSAVIINYLFSIDVQTHSLKSIIPLPVSRKEYITGKLLTLLVWMLLLSLITIVASFILFPIVGIKGFDMNGLLNCAGRFLYGTVLLFLVMIIIAFVVELTKNGSISLILATLLGFLNIAGLSFLVQNKILQYTPWILPGKLSAPATDVNVGIALAVVLITGIIGYTLLIYIFEKRDIQL